MTSPSYVAYELSRDAMFLEDLAEVSLQLTSGFRALKATYLEYSDTQADLHREFRLPIRRAAQSSAFECGSLTGPEMRADALSLVREVAISFCDDEGGKVAPIVVHAASLDRERRHVIHLLLLVRYPAMSGATGPTQRVIKAICIWEDSTRSAYGRKIEKLGEAYSFPHLVRAEGLTTDRYVDRFLLVNSIFEKKLGSLAFVNTEFVERAWGAMLRGSANPLLPWERRRGGGGARGGPGADVGTVTLSLDLRKSTYMMKQAQDRSHYAHWLEALAEIARDFTLRHGGIYDKFTGDGAISHFIYDTDDDEYMDDTQAICAAFSCAQDLILASSVHLRSIESNLDFLSGKSGPAVGIAHGPAAWSLDRDGRPVVVGAGVVSACRLCGGPSSSIRATIALKSVLEREFQDLEFDYYHLEDDHKDLPKVDDPICGQLFVNTGLVSISADAIRLRATAIWEEVKARHRG